MDTVTEIRHQYARVLEPAEWKQFKSVAEYYFETAAKLKKQDIDSIETMKLLLRNSQKRLFLGIGCELLLKSIYLKNGYCINKIKNAENIPNLPTNKYSSLRLEHVDANNTFTLSILIDHLKNILDLSREKTQLIERGLRIGMVFRNKEGHVSFPAHAYEPQNYRDVESSIASLYDCVYEEELLFRVSMEANEIHSFEIRTT